MASMSHYCLGASMSLRKTLNHKLSLVQPNNVNARHLSNPVVTSNVYSPIPKSTFPQLSLATKRQLNVTARNKENQRKLVWCSYDEPDFSSDFTADIEIKILIRKLFLAINSRSEQLLRDVLSDDCIFEDFIFQTPLVGEQNTIQFFRKLMKAMGPNIRFKINSIGDVQNKDSQSSVTAYWHLEWDDEEIPFTRGCSVFECGEVNETPLIRKIEGVAEPGKLGDFILSLLEAASTLFDNFPDKTKNLLSKSNK